MLSLALFHSLLPFFCILFLYKLMRFTLPNMTLHFIAAFVALHRSSAAAAAAKEIKTKRREQEKEENDETSLFMWKIFPWRRLFSTSAFLCILCRGRLRVCVLIARNCRFDSIDSTQNETILHGTLKWNSIMRSRSEPRERKNKNRFAFLRLNSVWVNCVFGVIVFVDTDIVM